MKNISNQLYRCINNNLRKYCKKYKFLIIIFLKYQKIKKMTVIERIYIH